ncbi:CPBP family intramembrane glutamic endopeptidase [Collimonas fungivorans]|uniref:Abortive infection protein n=1 Tax=Collimonas fungivorans (strain Ter331) TaxID=1005048 RepID=G0A7Y3_COLFT|nr:CPBP family intramembrane glutamic endopeptidase [Collimonas fungivorans]AEK59894.1 Abortive infection protein [Collimonas fungivorans Ter331]
MLITFVLLAAAIAAVWLKPLRLTDRIVLLPWMAIAACALVSGLAGAVLSLLAVLELALFCLAAYLAATARRNLRLLFGVAAAILALALALHKLPGFNNPILLLQLRLSADSAPFTQYANFDKGAAGLVLLAFLCARAESAADWRKLLRQTWPIALIAAVAVLSLATAIGYVKPDFKISQATALFLSTNLFFTVVAEEAFFRGLLQDRLALSLARFRYGPLLAVACSALLFGAAHIAGGGTYVLLATVAGLAYAYAYYVTQRIEAAIIVHFAVNAVHFIGFTYPHLN